MPGLVLHTNKTADQTYVLDNHDKERKLDSKRLLCVSWASDVVGAHVGSHDLQN